MKNTLFDDSGYDAPAPAITTWRNDTKYIARFRILTSEMSRNPFVGKFLYIKLKPGESYQLPSKYDDGIRKVDPKTNVIVGGMCPWLTKVDAEEIKPTMSNALDFETQNEVDEIKRLQESMAKRKLMEMKLQELREQAEQTEEAMELIEKKSVGRPKKNQE